jgi:D-amino-acid oxidase
LTVAVCLARAGGDVRVISDSHPLDTTSAVAGAIWGPYSVEDPRVLRWSTQTWHELDALAATDPECGVRMALGIEAFHTATEPPPWIVGDYDCVPQQELPSGYASGWRYRVPVVDMPVYIEFMLQLLGELGVPVETRSHVVSLDDLTGNGRAVVNCAGLGARSLVPDSGVYPVQGQLVIVDNPGLEGFFIDDSALGADATYYIAHGDHVVLGGTSVPYSERTNPDPAVGEAIKDRCAALWPELADVEVIDHKAGLRPVRRSVRLEREADVIHNYGHGGSGVTLSWGCARDVVDELAVGR